MSHLPKVLQALVRLLSYPDPRTAQAAELLYVVLHDVMPQAAHDAARFGEYVEQHELWELEEAFTRTFDVNPACALEVGWHLFGEEYARGMFLVRMRQELRKYGLPESSELPDHMTHVLAVVAAMPDDEAARFVRACVQPAVEKMYQALAGQDTPYRHVVACLASVIRVCWGEAHPPTRVLGDPLHADPLRTFPVADAGCGSGCGGSCGEQAGLDFVPLEVAVPGGSRSSHSSTAGGEG
jgi:nitrate reductase delta subunit